MRRPKACPRRHSQRLGPGRAFLPALALSLTVAGPSAAQEDFTFRRIKAADRVAGALITVQIDPAEQARRLAATTWKDPALKSDTLLPAPGEAPALPAPKSNYAWFWDKVPPGISDGADRFPSAMAALSQGPAGASVAAPRMQSMQTLAEVYGRDVLVATIGTKVSPALVLAVMGIESAGRKEAVSSAGATGLMQLMPDTAKRFGVSDSTDPAQNIKGGVAYLDWLMGEFGGDPVLVLAAYNAGEGAVRKNSGVPPYAETRDYVPKVLAAWQVAQGLCQTPPMLVSDPCVFKVLMAGG
ncbi:lytic transglycosylase domain-containing protein [Xinfangfangia sp. CPCC 101601]|uniref:Lytic transglycosylase domain-containing protein n=1 Tax=Pseudogemmobacter lacusdianii TaxID=3069608 RepID=A0ABU0VT50_9RHOB|nr:lytic transglycosylase domain-containing protein [Xinfangfangia sp. CPCC 101601]MDQ2064894.1 lytic transglycosylase domain-containing protein [Xinfangfangia sp. CPCC 101601]